MYKRSKDERWLEGARVWELAHWKMEKQSVASRSFQVIMLRANKGGSVVMKQRCKSEINDSEGLFCITPPSCYAPVDLPERSRCGMAARRRARAARRCMKLLFRSVSYYYFFLLALLFILCLLLQTPKAKMIQCDRSLRRDKWLLSTAIMWRPSWNTINI